MGSPPSHPFLRSVHTTLPRRIFPAHSPSSEQLWSSSQKHLMCHFIHKTYSISCFPVFVKGRILLAYLVCFVFLSSVKAASRFIPGSMMVTKYLCLLKWLLLFKLSFLTSIWCWKTFGKIKVKRKINTIHSVPAVTICVPIYFFLLVFLMQRVLFSSPLLQSITFLFGSCSVLSTDISPFCYTTHHYHI